MGKSRKDVIEDYDAFVDKFEVKKTTDDCYTPPAVYDAVVKYVASVCDIPDGSVILRPFYPEGDFENFEYPENCAVIDNPPFSILAKICRFYGMRGIRYFLFAPHLTLIASDLKNTAVVVGADITYENGAVINTSFLTNMLGDVRIMTAPELLETLKRVQNLNAKKLPKYKYPPEVLTVSKLATICSAGISVRVKTCDAMHIRQLDSQKPHKNALFGSGFLLNRNAVLQIEKAAEKAVEKAVEKAAEKAAEKASELIVWQLSEREQALHESICEGFWDI